MRDAPPAFGALLDEVTAVLMRGGVPDPRRTAIRLWSDLDGRRDHIQLLDRERVVGDDAAIRLLDAAARHVAGEPLEYVTGWTGFRHLVLGCDRRALIPRPETEGLVDAALARVRTGRAADIGTGTGAIALSLRHEGAFDAVIGIDLSPDALALACENGQRTGLDVSWRSGDLLAPLGGEPVDLLVSNPPYLTDAEHAALEPTVRDFEPKVALASGPDGLEVLRRLLVDARQAVTPDGWIALEVDARRAADAAAIAATCGWHDVVVQDDLFGRARYVLARQEPQQ